MNAHFDETTLPPAELVPLLEEVCDRFEEALKAPGSPRLEQFLSEVMEPVRAAVFRELLGLELDYRKLRGETPTREDYLGRFPEHTDLIEAALPASSAGTAVWIPPAGGSLRAVPTQEEKLPEFVARYRVIERLGSGGQGEVFRAIHPLLGQDVVIKWARRSVPQELRQQLIDEARILVRLDDPGLVRVYDADLHDGRPFIVMEYVPGRTLAEMLQRQEMPWQQAVALVADLAAILARLHPRGVYHRDLKPANVLVDAAGKPRLIDFGLACLDQAWQQIAPPEDGILCGTFAYMAPEQARGQGSVGGHTDVFGLGAILYQLLTRQPLYRGKTQTEVARLARQAQVTPPRQLAPAVPPALEGLCLRALAADPAKRPSASEFERALRRLLPRPRPGRRRWLAGVAGVGVLAVLSLLLGLMLRPNKPAEPSFFKGSIDIVMTRPGDAIRQLRRLNDPASRPLRMGDEVRIEVKMNRPAYLYVFWFDTEGKVDPVYPWLEGDWKRRRAEQPVSELTLPDNRADGVYPVNPGSAGMETLLLLARETPLPEDTDLGRALAGMKPQKRKNQAELGEVAWFEDSGLVTDEKGRAANLKDTGVSTNPVLRFQQELRERLGQRFGYTRAVTFGNLGGK
jgi:tRNA A-37 threonylcarbamoyl transferase component Bud32